MATLGKRVSSATAVACIWLGGSGILMLAYLIATSALLKNWTDQRRMIWLALPSPLVLTLGGVIAVWFMRRSSGWPKLALPVLFLRPLCLSIVSWALIPLVKNNLHVVVLVAATLGMIGAMSLAWQKAETHDLGTHVSPGSTLPPKPALPETQSDDVS